jgi:arylsulfatase A-like enzyme
MAPMWQELRRWPFVLGTVVLLGLYVSTLFEVRSNDDRPIGSAEDIEGLSERDDVNVLFIVIDTLRAHRLGSYGYERDTSPNLDSLVGSGVRFARHLSQSSWTKTAMASLWTGLNPIRTGVLRYNHAIPTEATMPAEILAKEGFRTAGIWRNGWVAPNFGFEQGFDNYQRPAQKPTAAKMRRESPHVSLSGSDADVLDSAIEFLRIHGHTRWFAYLHLMDVHQYAYSEDTALFGSGYPDMYDNSIRYVDNVIGLLLTHLSERGQLDDTLVVITSDHGEAFRERGLEGHARAVYRESTEVPFILSFPFKLAGGAVIDARTRNVDVWPTLLDLLGLPPLPDTDGRSLAPLILAAVRGEPSEDESPPAFAHLDRTWGQTGKAALPTVAVARRDLRFVYTRDASGATQEELFDQSVDVLEMQDMLAERRDAAAELRDLTLQYLEASAPSPWGVDARQIEIDQLQLQQLRALGYQIP